jgi:hypothetical protein
MLIYRNHKQLKTNTSHYDRALSVTIHIGESGFEMAHCKFEMAHCKFEMAHYSLKWPLDVVKQGAIVSSTKNSPQSLSVF